MKIAFLFWLIFVLVFSININAQNPYIRHYTTLDGLPTNTIYQMCQDSHKFLWFTSDAGVVKFDGSNFTSYRKKDGLSSNDVVRVKEDSRGRIWFFNYNGTVNYYYNNKIYNGENAPFLNLLTGKGFFLDFITDSDKTLSFYNYQGEVFSLDSNNRVSKDLLFKNVNIVLPLLKRKYMMTRISSLSKSLSNEWIFWANCGIFSQSILTGKITMLDSMMHSKFIFPARNNTLYAVPYYEGGLVKFTSNHQKEDVKFPGNVRKINSILEDSEGYLWITALDEGVFCIKNNHVIKHFDINNALGLLQDHEQNIWVSTQSDGVFVINHNVLTQNHFDHIFYSNSDVKLLCEFPGEGIWCLGSNSVALYNKEKGFYHLNVSKTFLPINLIYQFRNNNLLLGTKSNRLYTFENININKASGIINSNNVKLYSVQIKKIVDNRTGTLTVMFDQNRILYVNSTEALLDTLYKYISERINNVFFNAKNELVINAKKNYLFKNNKLEPYPELSRFNGSIITDHLVLNDSVELFNIDGDSLYLLKNKTFYNLTKEFNTPIPLQIKKILYYKSTLYLATLKDIFICYNPIKIFSGSTVQIKPLNVSFNNINDILFHKDSLFIASDDGLTIIPNASLNKEIASPPIPYFNSISVNDVKYSLPIKELTLTGKNNIQLAFGCISYFSSSVTYSYMLEGAEKKWSIGIGSEINVFYRNLPPGHYNFKLRVRKSNSDWSEPLILPVIIKPTLIEYPAFWAFLLLLSGIIVILFINRIRTQRIRRMELDHQLIISEQKALQSMMNPHFIFNSLGSIQNYLLKNKGSEAIIYLSNFARLIRQNLNSVNMPMIKLEDEVDRLRNYLELEKIRLEDKFEYTIVIDQDLEEDELYIPSMLIQPIVENSIWHGIATLKEQGMISINFQSWKSKSLKIRIEDNGIGLRQSIEFSVKEEHRQHLGMQMIKKRLALLSKKYKVEANIYYSECFPEKAYPGTLVELIVPFTYSAADQ